MAPPRSAFVKFVAWRTTVVRNTPNSGGAVRNAPNFERNMTPSPPRFGNPLDIGESATYIGAMARYFTPATLKFLTQLATHNERDWFNANKARFVTDVQEPALQFIADFAPRLAGLSEHLVADARPQGGSLFRIYRDTRFSKDKTPYKTH